MLPPRLGVLDFNPVRYHTALYKRLASRGQVALDVLFLNDLGYRPYIDHDFGVSIACDADLVSGFEHRFLTAAQQQTTAAGRVRKLVKWLPDHDAVVIYGHADPWMLLGTAICRSLRVPYLLRGDSHAEGQSTGIRRQLRNIVASAVVSGSAGGIAIGQLNRMFYARYGAPRILYAPYAADEERFAGPPRLGRSELLARWGMDDKRPVIMFCGKLHPGKRPLDLTAAVRLLQREVTVLMVGDGVLAGQIQAELAPASGVVTGFVSQSELPPYYHAADILVLPSEVEQWGLVINEAMAAGALPVVSDRVGAAPDLVQGAGEIYPCGDVASLAAALHRALGRVADAGIRSRIRQHAAGFSIDRAAEGFEDAAIAASEQRQE
jgi:glycosyltransferase involved in cell wall biosynthesis